MGSIIGNSLAKIESYKEYIQSKILEQYKGKENWDKLWTVICREFDVLENVFWDLYIKRWIDSSEGKQLDNIGYNLSVDRQGLNDNDYRQIIYGKIGQYNSNGTVNEIISIVKLMTNADLILVNELFPAKNEIIIVGNDLNLNEDYLFSTVKQSLSGGVGLLLLICEKTPIFCYAPESGDPLEDVNFLGYPSEDGVTKSYYAESI